MKSPPRQIHDDVARERVEAFIRGEDNETLVGTEKPRQADAPEARRGPAEDGDDRRFMTAGDSRRRPRDRVAPGDRRPSRRRTDRRLEAPHRRGASSPRIVERTAVPAIGRVVAARQRPAETGARRSSAALSQASYLAWPTKRRWSNRNFGQRPRPAARASAGSALRRCGAYAGYGRYLVELMRLPSPAARGARPPGPGPRCRRGPRLWREAPDGGGLIMAVGHVGSNEAVAAAIAAPRHADQRRRR